jgi:hypothetical protein
LRKRNFKQAKKTNIVCPKNKQFTDIIVCAANCVENRYCEIYRKKISLEILTDFVETHPNYKLIGELMAVKNQGKKTVTKFWIINEEKQVEEITEKEVMDNPQKYLNVEIWDKPIFKYEVVIKLKKVRVES